MKRMDTCMKCFHISQAFYGTSWETICKKFLNNKSFQADWKAAVVRYDDLVLADPSTFSGFDTLANVNVGISAGVTLSIKYWFLRLAEFLSLFKFLPKVLGFRVSIFKDEQGLKDLKGIVVRPTANVQLHRYRVITFHSSSQWEIDDMICCGRRRLRDDQPQEVYNSICKQKAKKLNLDCKVECILPILLFDRTPIHEHH